MYIDRVTKPTITCNMSDGSSSDKSGSEATLKCSAKTSQSLNYEWSQPGKIQPGQILSIPLGTEHDDKVYSCTASNRLSKEIATFTAKDCYPVGASAGLITGLVIGGIVILLCVLGAVFCAVKHKAKKEKTAAEQPHSDHESDQPSDPLLHRRETRPSSQKLHHPEETLKNSNSDHKDEKHKKLDRHTGKVKKMVQNIEQGQIDPVSIENEVEENRKKEDSKSDDMTNTISKQTESEKRVDEQTSVSLENGIWPSAVQPNSPLNDEAPVAAEDVNSQQAPGIKKENQSIGSGVENNKDEPKKVKPVVPVKSFKIRKGQANINPAREEEHSGATESGLQSSTAPKNPGSEQQEDEEPKGSTENGSSANQPSSSSINKPPVVGEDVSSEQVTEEKEKEKESDDKTKKEDPPTVPDQTGVENNKDEPKKVKPVVPVKSFKIRKGQANINPAREEEHSGATESGLQSSTAPKNPGSEQQEDEEPKGSTENGSSANQPSSSSINKPPVVGEDVSSEQVTEEKEKEKESDDKTKKEDPPTVPDQTGVENNKDEPKKVKPVVPVKSFKIRKGQANINPAREEEHSGATESGLQSSTAPKNPDLVKKADDDQMSAPENNASLSAAEPLSSLAPASPTMASKNDAGENVDGSNKEQATGQPNKEIVGKSSGSGEGN
ncbi:protein starmaker-like isoform X1 [Astatotilapia calliptera]|uniref:protein starmaker-like isoform X1 n=1 Tax=Astatotilapia calliptera TaxID=8154 RepID=UPI000E40B6D3|nr:protein starmaker-like isoform X1 [Astatotilapia calliptera]